MKTNQTIYLPNPSARADTRLFFKRGLTGLNSELCFFYTGCHCKVKEPNLPNYLLIGGGRIIGFMTFPRVLAQCEMQTALSRIWTQITASILFSDDHYTTSIYIYIYHHHHHHIVLAARISLTLSRHSSLSFIALGRSSGQQPVSSHSCWMYVRAGRPAFARPCVGLHESTSIMSSSLLLQQCPACQYIYIWPYIYIYIYIYIWPYRLNCSPIYIYVCVCVCVCGCVCVGVCVCVCVHWKLVEQERSKNR